MRYPIRASNGLAAMFVALAAAAAASGCGQAKGGTHAMQEKDRTDIRAVVTGIAATLSDDRLDQATRREKLREFYRTSNEQDLFFGPLIDPVVVGPDAYVDSNSTLTEWFKAQNVKSLIELDDTAIRMRPDMAVAVIRCHTVQEFSDGDRDVNPCRWTVALERGTDRRWRVFHEHVSFYADDETGRGSINDIKGELQEFKLVRPQ